MAAGSSAYSMKWSSRLRNRKAYTEVTEARRSQRSEKPQVSRGVATPGLRNRNPPLKTTLRRSRQEGGHPKKQTPRSRRLLGMTEGGRRVPGRAAGAANPKTAAT